MRSWVFNFHLIDVLTFVDFAVRCRWMSTIDGSPGFSEESLAFLRTKALESRPSQMPCSLIVDGMAIQRNVTWNSSTQKFVGYVDLGAGIQSPESEATEAIVILINGIFENWKQPIAYFLTKGISGGTLAEIIRDAIEILHDMNIRVVTITCDGDAKNQAALRFLGLQTRSMEGTITHPSNPEMSIYVFYDACHMLKLIRNTLKHCGKYEYTYPSTRIQLAHNYPKF